MQAPRTGSRDEAKVYGLIGPSRDRASEILEDEDPAARITRELVEKIANDITDRIIEAIGSRRAAHQGVAP